MNNEEKYLAILKKLDPHLFLIRTALEETHVNPEILPRVIRAISNLACGTRHGRIQIFMVNGRITHIKPEESDLLNLETLVNA